MSIQAGLVKLNTVGTFTQGWVWLDNNSQPINLVGATARCECRSYRTDKLLFAFDSSPAAGEGQVNLDPATGNVDLIMTPDISKNITGLGGPFDLIITLGTGQSVNFVSGAFQVRKPVTSGY